MRRFFVKKIYPEQGFCSIIKDEARHISKVLRMKKGDPLILMDQDGLNFRSVIEYVSPQKVIVSLQSPVVFPERQSPELVICQSVIKSHSMDYVIQKTSELGVDTVIPFCSERTVVRLDENGYHKRVGRWQRISQNSAKQCRRPVPAKIEPVISFDTLVKQFNDDKDVLKIILWEQEDSRHIKAVLNPLPEKIVGMIGPEGGFTKSEVEAAKEAGFIAVSLGARILRSETAATVFAAIVQYEFGDLSAG